MSAEKKKDPVTIINGREFRCPHCGGNLIIAVVTGATFWTPILKCTAYTEDEEYEEEFHLDKFGKNEYDSGDAERLECNSCRYEFEESELAELFGREDDE
jgi:hypothetical protein